MSMINVTQTCPQEHSLEQKRFLLAHTQTFVNSFVLLGFITAVTATAFYEYAIANCYTYCFRPMSMNDDKLT